MLLPKIAKISRGSLEFIHVKRHRSEALGDIRADLDPAVFPHVICDAARLPFSDQSFDSVLCDPPYNGKFRWNHNVLSELSRIANKRIIFQHWFMPADPYGRWKNATTFVWRLRTSASPEPSFGRVQVITVFDVLRDAGTSRAERDVGIAKAPMFRSSGRDYVRIWLSCSSDDHFTT